MTTLQNTFHTEVGTISQNQIQSLIQRAINQQKISPQSNYYDRLSYLYDISESKPVTKEQFIYNEARKMVVDLLTEKLKEKREVPVWDEESKKLYQLLTMYFLGMEDFEKYYFETKDSGKIYYKLNKGLLLTGNTGRSKSFSMNFIYPVIAHKFGRNQFISNKYSAEAIATDCAKPKIGSEAIDIFRVDAPDNKGQALRYFDIYIDEIGIEDTKVNHYSNTIYPIKQTLDYRNVVFEKLQKRTHISTNLSLADIREKYGERIWSRCFGMFNIIVLKGNDLRIKFEK